MSCTPTRDQIAESVLAAIDNLNPQLPDDRQVERSLTARLFGREAPLDSLGLVNLIVAVEEQLADDLDLSITLANEKAMSRKTSPFRSVDVLIDFICEMLTEESKAAA
jgi:acyl carrier protein